MLRDPGVINPSCFEGGINGGRVVLRKQRFVRGYFTAIIFYRYLTRSLRRNYFRGQPGLYNIHEQK